MMNEIIYFVIALSLTLVFIYYTIKLIDQWKMKRLRKKYPEGKETISRVVSRLDDVPISKIDDSVKEDLLDKLKD